MVSCDAVKTARANRILNRFLLRKNNDFLGGKENEEIVFNNLCNLADINAIAQRKDETMNHKRSSTSVLLGVRTPVLLITSLLCFVSAADVSAGTQLFFDDFTGTALDTSKWSVFVDVHGVYNWPYVVGGLLHSQGYHTRIDSIPTFAPTGQSVIARGRIRLAGDYHKFGFGVGPNERAGPITGYYFDTFNRFDESMGREDYVHVLAWSNPGDGSLINLRDVEIPVTWYEFHEFAIERTPSEVIYSIDGQEVARVADTYEGALPVGVWNDRWSLMQTDWVEVSQVSEPEWSFVHMTDLHIGAEGAEERLMDAFRQIEEENHELILVTGDIVEYAAIEDPIFRLIWDSGFFNRYNQVLDSYPDTKSKVYEIPGNHDRCIWNFPYWLTPDLPLYGYFGLSLYEEYIRPKDDYSFHLPDDNHDSIEFIGLDTGWGHTDGWGLYSDQIDWLSNVMQQNKSKLKVIFMHHPFMDISGDDQSFQRNKEDFLDCINSNNVQVILEGHTHEDHIWEGNINGVYVNNLVETPSLGKDSDPSVYRIIDVKDGKVIPRQVTEVKRYDKKGAALHSAGNLHVYDSIGRHVGMSDSGQAERGIPDSFYFSHYSVSDSDGKIIHSLPEEIILYDTAADYIYEVVGTQTGTYRLVINSVENGNEKVFEAIDIPTSPGQIHDYIVDWDALSQGQDGVTVKIDTDGDGDFEAIVVSDGVLTRDEIGPLPVNGYVSISSGLVSFDRRTGQFSANVTVKNTSATVVNSPVWLVIESISNPAVTLAGADGTTADGKPYIDLSGLLGDGKLSPAETISKRVYFNNPSRVQFTFKPSVRGVILP